MALSKYNVVELIPSRKNGNFLHIDHYLYTKNSGSLSSTAYWVCRDRDGCDGRAITKHIRDRILVYQGPEESEHKHGPIPDDVEAAKRIASAKRRAVHNPEAAIKSYGNVVKACLFHLSQSVYRHVQSEGLQKKYAEDADIRDGVHMLCALAFVPVEDVE